LILWRLCRLPHANLAGQGGMLVSGRWHTQGQPIVYTAAESSLTVLEVRVNLSLDFADLPLDYVLLRIDTGAAAIETLETMPENPREFGNTWLRTRRSPLLCVPSIIVPQARNVLLNPAHPEAPHARITDTTPFRFDARLWSV
jgi:RES domain-containing protein